MVLTVDCWPNELNVCRWWDFWRELLMRGGRAGPLLGRELYAENADRDLVTTANKNKGYSKKLNGRFPFNQNFRKIGNRGKWYRNVAGFHCWISEMQNIQPKILEIPGAKRNGKKTSGKNFFENLGVPREVDLFNGNFGKCCSIRYWKLSKIQSRRFGRMESAQWLNKQTFFKQIPKHYDHLPL